MPTLFLAEDDQFMIRLYERAFAAEGYDLKVAKDGEEALAALAGIDPKPAVIILDVMMPKVNGLDVLAKIKEDPALRAIPVVMLTNLEGKENEDKARGLGALEYLAKSENTPDQVVAKVLARTGK